jgi:hypothetical protein
VAPLHAVGERTTSRLETWQEEAAVEGTTEDTEDSAEAGNQDGVRPEDTRLQGEGEASTEPSPTAR